MERFSNEQYRRGGGGGSGDPGFISPRELRAFTPTISNRKILVKKDSSKRRGFVNTHNTGFVYTPENQATVPRPPYEKDSPTPERIACSPEGSCYSEGDEIYEPFSVQVMDELHGGTEVALQHPTSEFYQDGTSEWSTTIITPRKSPKNLTTPGKQRPSRVQCLSSAFTCGIPSTIRDAADGVKEIWTREKRDDSPLKHAYTPSPPAVIGSIRCGCWSPDDTPEATRRQSLELTISALLSDPLGSWCDGWQAWSMLEECKSTDPKEIKIVMRNRICDLDAKSRRIKTLQTDLSPFDLLLAQSDVKRVQSFSFRPVTPSPTMGGSATPTGSMWDSVQSCGDSAILPTTPTKEYEDDLCYDSDPEDIRHRSVLGRNRNANLAMLYQTGTIYEHSPQSRRRTFKHFRDESDNAFDIGNESHVKRLVGETMNNRITFVWHGENDCSSSTPVAVRAWIEHGAQLRSKLIQPKLMWKRINGDGPSPAFLLGNKDLYSVDLLDITRILEAKWIDRSRYPLAKRKSSFVLTTLERAMVFEASSEEERDAFVKGLKLLVARLGSRIIVGDGGVFEEFFSAYGNVPGEAPEWTNH